MSLHRELIQRSRLDSLTTYILDQPTQRKRVMKVKEVVQKWLTSVAMPQIQARSEGKSLEAALSARDPSVSPLPLGNTLLDQAREILQLLQDEEQITLNQRMAEQDWAIQSTQILDFLPKLERAVLEMQKSRQGFLLTNDNGFAEAYKRAITDFYTYNGYLSILVARAIPAQAQLFWRKSVRTSKHGLPARACHTWGAKRDGKWKAPRPIPPRLAKLRWPTSGKCSERSNKTSLSSTQARN